MTRGKKAFENIGFALSDGISTFTQILNVASADVFNLKV